MTAAASREDRIIAADQLDANARDLRALAGRARRVGGNNPGPEQAASMWEEEAGAYERAAAWLRGESAR